MGLQSIITNGCLGRRVKLDISLCSIYHSIAPKYITGTDADGKINIILVQMMDLLIFLPQ